MRGKKIVLVAGCLALLFTGCDKEEVIYSTETFADSETIGTTETNVEGIDNDNPLIEKLGITDSYKWKESIPTDGSPIDVSAEIYLLDTSELVAVNAKEHYYSEADKQGVLNYFFDLDSIQVDPDTYPTKELLREKLEEYEMVLKKQEADTSFHVKEDAKVMIDNEVRYLTELINKAPNKNEVSEGVTNYSENYYKGKINGLDYSLVFNIDETRNQSGWKLSTKDYNDILISESDVTAWQYAYYTDGISNQCKITGEEAQKIADQACKDLGFTHLQPYVDKIDVVWHMENGDKECNGYYFEYGLDMNGEALYYSNAEQYGGYVDSTFANLTYNNQKVTVIVNDFGIVRMECTALMQYEKANRAKLLSYEQIKDCFRNVLKEQSDTTETWNMLTLCYIRLMNADNQDMYSYIPVWILSNYTTPSIVINAIDGTQIDMERNNYVFYDTPKDWVSEYYNIVLEKEGILSEYEMSAVFD